MAGFSVFLIVLIMATSGCARLDIDHSAKPAQDNARDALARQLAELDPPERRAFRPCLLATDCLALDDRPFQVCLLGAERCPQDAELSRVPLDDQP